VRMPCPGPRIFSPLEIDKGQRYSYSGQDMTVEKSSSGVIISFVETTSCFFPNNAVPEIKRWILQFRGPKGRFLQVGEHGGAGYGAAAPKIGITLRFEQPKMGDLYLGDLAPVDLYSERERGLSYGEFVVWELEMKDQKVVRLAIDFIIGETFRPSEYKASCGSLRVNSSFCGSLRVNSSFQPEIPALPQDAAE